MAIDLPAAPTLADAMVTTPTSLGDWLVVAPVLACLAGSALAVMALGRPRLQRIAAVLAMTATLTATLALLVRVLQSGPVSMTMGRWLPPFGISFTADVLGALFAAVATAVALVTLVPMLAQRPEQGAIGPLPLVLLLLGGVNGAFLTGDLFNLYVWFEVMLLASFGLLVLDNRDISLDATVKYGFLNFLATAFFLVALGLLYGLTGALNMADLLLRAPSAPQGPMVGVAALLVLGFGMKAAAFPVNAWLPASYHVPSAPIAALMAGLLTKVGAYALLRTLVMVLPEARQTLEPVLVILAVGTLLLGPLGAIAETNLRRALGFLLIGGVGAILAGLSLPGVAGVAGSALYAVHAMLTMAALYLIAGQVERVTGAADSRQMGGLYARYCLLSIGVLILILGVAGLPPFLGFWPKLLLVQGAIERSSFAGTAPDPVGAILLAALLLNAFLTLVAGARLWSHIFWKPAETEPAASEPAASPVLTVAPVAVLVAIVALAGLWPEPLIAAARQAAIDLLDPARYLAATGLGGMP